MLSSSPDVLIRSARSGDLESCVSLLSVLFSIEKDFEVRPAKQRAGLRLLLDSLNALVLVAELQGEIVGMATLQCLVSTAEGGLSGLVEDVVVAEEHRHKGIGSLLLEGLESRALEMGITRLQLLADRTNTPAQAFYRSLGWSPTRMENWRKNPSKNTEMLDNGRFSTKMSFIR